MDVAPSVLDADRIEAVRAWFREDSSRMTMMAARKFEVPEQVVVATLIGQWPIVPLRDDCFRELMEACPDWERCGFSSAAGPR